MLSLFWNRNNHSIRKWLSNSGRTPGSHSSLFGDLKIVTQNNIRLEQLLAENDYIINI